MHSIKPCRCHIPSNIVQGLTRQKRNKGKQIPIKSLEVLYLTQLPNTLKLLSKQNYISAPPLLPPLLTKVTIPCKIKKLQISTQ